MTRTDHLRSTRLWFLILPGLVLAMGFVALWLREATHEVDLVLRTPDQVSAGDWLPAESLLFALTPHGLPEVLPAQSELLLREPGGAIVASTQLVRSACLGEHGVLRVPPDVPPGRYRLELRTRSSGSRFGVSKSLAIARSITLPSAESRAMHALQQLRLGEIKSTRDGQSVPERLTMDPVVASGACVPEHPCEVIVHAEGMSSMQVQRPAGLIVQNDHASFTDGLASIVLRVRGPEATFDLVVSRNAKHEASRSVRLPIVPAGPYVSMPQRKHRPGQKLRFMASPVAASGCLIADVFARRAHGEQWVHTQSWKREPGSNHVLHLGVSELSEGTYRLQLRSDAFSADAARSVMFQIDKAAEQHTLLERAVALRDVDFAFQSASAEALWVGLPETVRSLPQQRARAKARRTTWGTWLAVLGMISAIGSAAFLWIAASAHGAASEKSIRVLGYRLSMTSRVLQHLTLAMLSVLVLLAVMGAFILVMMVAHIGQPK